MKRTGTYGIMAEFDSATSLMAAAHRTREAGYIKLDAYSPFPIEGLAEAIGFHSNAVPLVVLIGALIGGLLVGVVESLSGLYLGESLGHEQSHFIAAVYADQRQADAGVPRGGLDDRAPGRKLSFLLRAPNDPNGCPIFHAAARIQVLQLGEHIRRPGRNQPLQLQHGSFADQLGDVVGYAQAGHFRSFRSHLTGYGGVRGIVNGTKVSVLAGFPLIEH